MSSVLDQLAESWREPAIEVEAGASLEITLGKLAATLGRAEQREQARRLRYSSLHTIPITGPPLAAGLAAGAISSPETFGPHDGFIWHLTRLTANGFTAGSVTAYIGESGASGTVPNYQNALVTWNSAGTYFFGGVSTILLPHDRLIFYCSGITGTVLIGGQAIEMVSELLPEYLL